ncbi:phosphotransferase [Kitasatospora sp. NBC_00039]|uniref:phosphotransferase family protein n=1 Tax=Kitasatospora sp. NBC_00039 TaxID=2903565 RepID=UPI002F91A338
MQPMRHGYTNDTAGDGEVVVKRYRGPDRELRLAREAGLLRELRRQLPVAPVRAAGAGTLTLGFMAGELGQDLVDAGRATAALGACGAVLRRIQQVDPVLLRKVPGMLGAGEDETQQVLVHGDFGPNNLLLDPGTFKVNAVLDWEFAHLGAPVEDLAWCEWIMRMHHPGQLAALDAFFDAYGHPVPPWPLRRQAMLDKCEALRTFCERQEAGGAGARLWQERAEVTAEWRE